MRSHPNGLVALSPVATGGLWWAKFSPNKSPSSPIWRIKYPPA